MKSSDDQWTVVASNIWKDPIKTSVARPRFLFNVNEHAGTLASLSITSSSSPKPLQGRDYLIVCGANEVRCFSSQNKDRIAKAEWKMHVQHVEVIERGGAPLWRMQDHVMPRSRLSGRSICPSSLYSGKGGACVFYPPSGIFSQVASRRGSQQVR